jgi:hypothetical protein
MGSGRSSAGARARHSCLRQPTRPASRRPSTGSAPSTRRHKATAAMPRPDRRLARRRSRQRHLHPRPTGHAAIRRHRSGRPPAAARAACNRHAPSRGSWPAEPGTCCRRGRAEGSHRRARSTRLSGNGRPRSAPEAGAVTRHPAFRIIRSG